MPQKHFRRSLCGFNRNDVIRYIEELCSRLSAADNVPAKDYDELSQRCSMMQQEIRKLRDELLYTADELEVVKDEKSVSHDTNELLEKIDTLKKENAELRRELYKAEEEADKLRFAAEAARVKLAEISTRKI